MWFHLLNIKLCIFLIVCENDIGAPKERKQIIFFSFNQFLPIYSVLSSNFAKAKFCRSKSLCFIFCTGSYFFLYCSLYLWSSKIRYSITFSLTLLYIVYGHIMNNQKRFYNRETILFIGNITFFKIPKIYYDWLRSLN